MSFSFCVKTGKSVLTFSQFLLGSLLLLPLVSVVLRLFSEVRTGKRMFLVLLCSFKKKKKLWIYHTVFSNVLIFMADWNVYAFLFLFFLFFPAWITKWRRHFLTYKSMIISNLYACNILVCIMLMIILSIFSVALIVSYDRVTSCYIISYFVIILLVTHIWGGEACPLRDPRVCYCTRWHDISFLQTNNDSSFLL